jgi:hypothetical protein
MAPHRIGAAFPHALSFARTTIRNLLGGGWKLERLRIDFDAKGNGELLYRFANRDAEFHFFVCSKHLGEEQRLDRNFAADWDAKAALCLGPWTAEREAHMRRETQKMRHGRSDYDTLAYVRANRSGRLFDHVVERLAAGRQPDADKIASVGYILRTTGFTANGQLGTRPIAGFESDNPLRSPYAAQIVTAFLLREYVFDLVEHMAIAQSAKAVALAPAYKRYLGVGNSAATGLVGFFANHPRLINNWCCAREEAYAEAKSRPIADRSETSRKLHETLSRAILYFMEDPRDGQGIFADNAVLATELGRVRDTLRVWETEGQRPVGAAPPNGAALCAWAERNCGAATVEVLHSVLLEQHPDVIERFSVQSMADEEFDVDPAMTIGGLMAVLTRHYRWALDDDMFAPDANRYFWFRSITAPLDVRRGTIGALPDVEFETSMDIGCRVHALHRMLGQCSPTLSVGEFLLFSPEFRASVARAQSLSGCEYAELRDNLHAEAYSPFGAIRFVLSFFGLDKFDLALPKSVRGALLQGAPTAADLAQGSDGDWPFPLKPASADEHGERSSIAHRLAPIDLPEAPRGAEMVLAPVELRVKLEAALQGQSGMRGVAMQGARHILASQIMSPDAIPALLRHLDSDVVKRAPPLRQVYGGKVLRVFHADGGSALLAAPAALDLAAEAALRASASGSGAVMVVGASGMPLLDMLPLLATRLGVIAILRRPPESGSDAGRIVVAMPEEIGSALSARILAPHEERMAITGDAASILEQRIARLPADVRAIESLEDWACRLPLPDEGYFIIVCMRADGCAEKDRGALAFQKDRRAADGRICLSDEEWKARVAEAHRYGLRVARDDIRRLDEYAKKILVSVEDEKLLRPAGFDPVKSF